MQKAGVVSLEWVLYRLTDVKVWLALSVSQSASANQNDHLMLKNRENVKTHVHNNLLVVQKAPCQFHWNTDNNLDSWKLHKSKEYIITYIIEKKSFSCTVNLEQFSLPTLSVSKETAWSLAALHYLQGNLSVHVTFRLAGILSLVVWISVWSKSTNRTSFLVFSNLSSSDLPIRSASYKKNPTDFLSEFIIQRTNGITTNPFSCKRKMSSNQWAPSSRI